MRDPLRQLKRAVTMPPGELVSKLVSKTRQRSADRNARADDLSRPTYRVGPALGDAPTAGLARLIGPIDPAWVEPHRPVIEALAERALAHEFDLLGSGWTRVENTHGLQVTEANREEAERTAALLPAGYVPIDWHVDFKSGHRWDPRGWYRDQPQVVGRGIDVKVPWELSRMQHLPLLAWRYALAGGSEDALRWRDAYRAQVLDFIAHNPPRFGINWNCAMDVGIRVAGWLLSFDLFRAVGAGFDDAFLRVFERSVREHADHLAANLEWDERIRGNHYLADVAGLLIASGYLPADATTDRYLHFAARELIAETLRQFHPDGSNFEASTSYHRLSAEVVVYALAVLQGVTPKRTQALLGERWHPFRPGEPSPELALQQTRDGRATVVPPEVVDRVAHMARFTEDLLDRHGRDPQIGDNDNGRFFKLLPAVRQDADGTLREDTRNHRHLIDAVDGFFIPPAEVEVPTTSRDREGADAVACANKRDGPLPYGRGSLKAETQVIRTLLAGVTSPRPDLQPFTDHAAYPGMGVYLYRHGRLTTIVRCGEVGQHGHGGHAHDDQLSFVLYADGEPVFIDPGTGCYTADTGLRNKMRHYAQHNTVTRDDSIRRYAELEQDGLFRMRDRAEATLLACSAVGLVGRHRLFGKPVRREFRCWADELEVVDQPQSLVGRRAVLHLAPGVTVVPDGEAMLLRAGGVSLRLSLTHNVPIDVERGAYSHGYGETLVEVRRLTYRLSAATECVCRITIKEPDA